MLKNKITKRWPGRVTKESNALDFEEGVFTPFAENHRYKLVDECGRSSLIVFGERIASEGFYSICGASHFPPAVG